MGMKAVVIHIDRLVLKGFRHGERHAIALGLQKELGRVFGDREAVQQLSAAGDRTRLSVGGVPVEHGVTPEHIGVNVARGINEVTKR
jgi:hypothetical protein